MKITKYIIALLTMLGLTLQAQPLSTNAIGTVLGQPAGTIFEFLSTPSTNWYSAAYGIVGISKNNHSEVGAGIAAFYKVNDYVGAAMRLDEFGGHLYMPSGNFQLSVPTKILGKVELIPFAFTGVALPLGHGGNNAALAGIFGAGLAYRLPEHTQWWIPNDVLVDVEKWTSSPGTQLRAGVAWKF